MSYVCPSCRKEHDVFIEAGDCCHANFVECPLSELPENAELGFVNGTYAYGTVFTGRWELVLHGCLKEEPTRVYPLPLVVSEMVSELAEGKLVKLNYRRGMTVAVYTGKTLND